MDTKENTEKNWVEETAKDVNAAQGNDYVKLDHGLLTVDQLNNFLNALPMELSFVDKEGTFVYYNQRTAPEDMLAKREPEDLGKHIGHNHPGRAREGMNHVMKALETGATDVFRRGFSKKDDDYVVSNYRATRDKEGNYAGINQYVFDIHPMIDWYLKQTNQELVPGEVDATSGASEKK